MIRADIFKDSRGKSKGCGIVAFKSQSDAMKAIDEFDGFMFQGRKIDVREVSQIIIKILEIYNSLHQQIRTENRFITHD